jgi:type I restriction enzyme S subunit
MKNGWPTKTLGEACQIKPPKSEARELLATNALVSFLPMENMGINEMFVRATQQKPLSAVQGSYTYFADGDVLLAKITPCFENGKLGIAENLTNGIGFGSSEYIVFRPDKTISKEWLYYFLSRETFRVEGAARMSGAVGHKRVSKEFIESYPIPVPPLPEQQRIVGILDEAFAGIATAQANAEKNLQNARALFDSYLESIFTQRGKGWLQKPFEDCIEDVKYTVKIQRKDFLDEGEFPVISQEADFTNGYWNKAADVFKVTKPIVIFGDHTKVLKYVDFDFVLGADGVKILPPKQFLIPKFFYYHLRSANLKSLGYARHYRLLKELEIGYPDSGEQTPIVKKLDALAEETERLASLYERKLAALDTLKKSLLHQAFTEEL